MNENVKINYDRWMNSPSVTLEEKEILKNMSQNEIDDAFFQDIKFGTAGMRGIIGPGTNRMNYHTVKKVTIAFGQYLLDSYEDAREKGVVISHDNRFMSREFTLYSAEILNNMGINTYIFDSLRPTPELSFAVRFKKCVGGIMITASHNPKEYNGYKVYDSHGCQLTPDKIKPLLDIIAKLPDELSVEETKTEEKGINTVLNEVVDNMYMTLVETVQINPLIDKSKFKIVYTPNHGASFTNAMRVFKECGYNIYPVLSQCDPDPNFSGTLSPNPEDEKSYIEAIKLAKEVDAHIICMTDPDGDRVGLAVKNKAGEYVLLTGNESAALLLNYILKETSANNTLPKNPVMYNTVVTSSLGRKIAAKYGVATESFLTGFKYIGDRIQYYEENGGPNFVFGYEESYGCLIKPFARDKDGIQAILLYCEMACYYFNQGKTLDEVYEELGNEFGHHKSKLYNIYFKGSSGSKKMNDIMDDLIKNPITELNGNKVEIIEDYFNLKKTNVFTNKVEEIKGLPVGDLIKFIFTDGTNISIRPSGTEPKCKFYVEVVSNSLLKASEECDLYYQKLLEVKNIKD